MLISQLLKVIESWCIFITVCFRVTERAWFTCILNNFKSYIKNIKDLLFQEYCISQLWIKGRTGVCKVHMHHDNGCSFACGGGSVHASVLVSELWLGVKMTDPEVCMLHLDRNSTETVKPFDDQTWKKVYDIQRQRRSMYKISKFFKIILPEQIDGQCGHHKSCYKDFTALPCATDTDVDELPAATPLLRSKVDHPTSSRWLIWT